MREDDDDDFDDDFDDLDGMDYDAWRRARDADDGRDAVVMLIDASPRMFTRDETRDGGASAFTAAARACFEFARARVVVAPDDAVGVCAYNCANTLGGLGQARVCEVMRVDAPSAAGAMVLSEYADGDAGARKFRDAFGALDETEDGGGGTTSDRYNQEDALTAGLWTASHMLEHAPRRVGRKTVYLFTNEPKPLRDGSAGAKLIARAKEMAALGQSIEVLSLTRDGEFDSSIFYDEFTAEHCGAKAGERALVVVRDGTELQREFLKKSRKRRRLRQTELWLVPGKISIPVGVYSLVSEAKKSSAILVDGKDLGEIRREQIFVDAATGAQIEKPTKSFVEFDGKELVFTNKELAKIKQVKVKGMPDEKGAVGFHLVGFIDAKRITRDLCLKKSHFIAGEEKGCAAVNALIRACDVESKVAICAYVRAKSAGFRYVALLPQLAPHVEPGLGDADDAIARLDPPEGFHVFYLPFRDDVRHPESVAGSVKKPAPRATKEQIDAARNVVEAIRLTGWHPKQTPNPALQTHYRVLEMCALERNVMEPVHDDTEPALDEWARVGVPALLADYDDKCFGASRAIDDWHGVGAPNVLVPVVGDKRKSIENAGTRAKRSVVVMHILPEHVHCIDLVKRNALSTMTGEALKHFCAAHGLSASGTKAQLIERVDSHVKICAPSAL